MGNSTKTTNKYIELLVKKPEPLMQFLLESMHGRNR